MAITDYIARWKLDETSGTTAADETGDYDGTYVRDASNTTVAGAYSGSTGMLGNGTSDKVSLPTGILNGATAFTASVWVKVTLDATANRGILGFGQEGNRLLWLYYQTDGTITVSGSSVGNTNDIGISLGAGTLATGQWVHFTITWNGTTCLLYKNGAQAGSDTSLASTLKSGDTLSQLGKIGTYATINGTLDDVRIYDRALTPAEVTQVYLDGAVITDYIARWKLDDESGTTAVDETGDYNGTYVNSPTLNVTGAYGSSTGVTFDRASSEWVSIASGAILRNVAAGTLSAWIKYTDTTSGTYAVSVGLTRAILVLNAGGTGKFGCYANSGGGESTQTKTTTATYNDGNWHHLVGVIDYANDTITIYVDGVAVAASGTIAFTGTATLDTNAAVGIAARSDGLGAVFSSATIDDVRIYNRALGPGEALALTRDGANIATNLLHKYELDTGTGTYVYDTGSALNHGRLGETIYTPTWTTGYESPYCLDFDGSNDYAEWSSSFGIGGKAQVVVAGWIKPNSSIANYSVYFSQYASTTSRFEIGVGGTSYGTTRDVLVSICNGADVSGYTTSTPLTYGAWNHVIVVYDGGQSSNATKIQVYVNGAKQTLTFSAGTVSTTAPTLTPTRIGRRPVTGSSQWYGSIDSVRVYVDRTFNAGAASRLFSQSFTPTPGTNYSDSIDGLLSDSPTDDYLSVFSNLDLVGSTSSYNSNLWGGGGALIDWTGITWTQTNDTGARGVAITKRHVLCPTHGGNDAGETATWVKQDGTLVTGVFDDEISNIGGATDTDSFRVLYLTEDLPSGIAIYRVWNDLTTSFLNLPCIKLDNENKALIALTSYIFGGLVYTVDPGTSPRDIYYEDSVGGDSGKPIFLLAGTELVYLSGLTTAPYGNGPDPTDIWDDLIDACVTLDVDGTGYLPQRWTPNMLSNSGLSIGIFIGI